MTRSRWLPWAATGAFLAPLVPEIVGTRLLVFRDAFVTHFPIQLYSLARERGGEVPFLNLGASNVEPLLANPNTVSLYPTHLLFHVLGPAAAFNLHLLLHVVWAFLGAAALCRRLGSGRPASWIGAATYAFSGPFLSYGSAFANATAAAAWAPWAVSEAVRLGRSLRNGSTTRARKAVLALGIALGLQLLAGEPAISAWTWAAVLAVSIAFSGRGARKLPGAGAAAAGLAAALAAPQILATAAAIPYSFRGEHLFSREQFSAAANLPIRAVETLFPLVFGAPRPLASGAFWAYRAFVSLQPYLYSMNIGLAGAILVATALAKREFRRSRSVLILIAAAGLLVLLSFGFRTPLFEILYAVKPLRHFRYPVKFALPATLCAAALVSLAARDSIAGEGRQTALKGTAAAAGALFAIALLGTALARGTILRALEPQTRGLAISTGAILSGALRTVRLDCLFGLAAAALLWAAASARRRGARAGSLLGAVLLCLLPSGWRLFVSTPTAPYVSTPPLARAVAGRGRVWVGPISEFAVAKFGTSHRFPADDVSDLILAGRREIWPLTALPDGVAYSFDTDPDGSYGYVDRVMGEALSAAPPERRSRILRNAATRFYISARREPMPGFRLLASQETFGRSVFLFEAVSPVPAVRCSSRVFSRSSLSGAIELIESRSFDPASDVILRGPDRSPPPGAPAENRVSSVRFSSSGISADVDSSGPAVAVFAATYFRYWLAAVDGIRADVEIANGGFCGVRVPPGRHRVDLLYDACPFVGGCIATALLLAALLVSFIFFRPAPASIRRSPKPQSRPAPEA
ncbi:MAG: hypothetical protein ACRD16_15315 [Thermoanaerobaculia bacterium]